MRGMERQLTYIYIGVELFAHLASERVCVAFVLIDFATREFPQALEVDTGLPSGHEKRVVLFDDSRNDHNGGSLV